MNTLANDNYRPVEPGQCFYPEMGERHDGKALFIAQSGHGGYYLSWKPARHQEALAAFKVLKIRPRYMAEGETTKGDTKWSCCVTWDAGRKTISAKYAVIEALLD